MQLVLTHELKIQGARYLSATELRGYMEERFTWAVSRGHAVSALVCEPIGLQRGEHQEPGFVTSVLSALTLTLEPAFRPSEAVAHLEKACLVVLLVGPDPQRMEAACQAWIGGAKELRIDGHARPIRIGLKIGYGVTQPGKRLFLETLLEVARAGLDVARYRAAGACVHTMLYDVLQDRLERERGTKGIVVTANVPLGTGEPVGADVPRSTPQRRAHEGEPLNRMVAAPSSSAPAPGTGPTDTERRERELIDALDTERRENEALRARLQALQTAGPQESTAAPSESTQDTRVELLERRLAKVIRTLQETEERLARIQQHAVDSEIARYRPVQGLAADAPFFALKTALMQQIFEANLRLRELTLARRPQFSSTESPPELDQEDEGEAFDSSAQE